MSNSTTNGSNSNPSSLKLLSSIPGLSVDAIKDFKGLESLRQSSMESGAPSYGKLMEELKKNQMFDYKSVLDMLKSNKNIAPEKITQIEKVFDPKGEKFTENTLKDALELMKELCKNEPTSEQDEEGLNDSEVEEEEDDESMMEDDGDSCFEKSPNDHNLMDSIKENIDGMLGSNAMKRKTTKKRWWTPEEVESSILCK